MNCTVTSFCPACQVKAQITLTDCKGKAALVTGYPTECNREDCVKRDSVKCLLQAVKITTRRDK